GIRGAVAVAPAGGVLPAVLSPDTGMVGALGGVLVLGGGVAKVPAPGGAGVAAAPAGDSSRSRDTAAGTRVGTPAYMSPEQARGELDRVDERADVYALGAILHFLLEGEAPTGPPSPDARPPRRPHAARRQPPAPEP